MIATLALCALTLAQATAAAPQETPLVFPEPPPAAPQELLSWKGWGYMGEGNRVLYSGEKGLTDFAALKQKLDALTPRSDTVEWREKVFILTSADVLDKNQDGLLHSRFANFEDPHVLNLLQTIRRLQAEVAVATQGRVDLKTDVTIERERLFDTAETKRPPIGPDFLRQYLQARFNGGLYEAEDKVYRGPYDGVLVLQPALSSSAASLELNGTPVDGYPVYSDPSFDVPGALDPAIFNLWLGQVARRKAAFGGAVPPAGYLQGLPFHDPATIVSPSEWPTIAALKAPSTAEVLALAKAPSPSAPSTRVPTYKPVQAHPLSIVQDPDRGDVVRYRETDPARPGEAGTPRYADSKPLFDLSATPGLSFWVKSTSEDPVAIRLDGAEGHSLWVSLGPDRPAPAEGAVPITLQEAAFAPGPGWQHVTVDLSAAAKKAGVDKVYGMAIGPTPNMRTHLRRQTDRIEYLFDGFAVGPAGPSPAAAPDDTEVRAAQALALGKAGLPSSDLAKLLKDPADVVRLNAAAAYMNVKDPTVEPDLVAASISTNPRIAEFGVRALAHQDTDSAKAALLRALRIGVTDHSRAVAAQCAAEMKDPKLAGAIVVLLERPSWVTRLDAVQALAAIPGREAAIMRTAFLSQTDPEIKLEVTKDLDPADDEQMRRALWSAVNEPSDAVRLWSDYVLIQSPDPANRKEGYKGVRDDSVWVREALVDLLAAHPNEQHRAAYQLAVTDASAPVRAAALRAFASLDQPTTLDEIQNVLADPDPRVQLALIALSKRKGLKLPKATLDLIHASPDPRVLEAAKELSS